MKYMRAIRSTQLPFRLHIVVKPQYQANNSRARSGCACSSYGMEIVRFLGGICLTLKGFCQQINGEIFAFWHFSVTYNVSFTRIICISLPHRLKVFFLYILYYKLYDLQI